MRQVGCTSTDLGDIGMVGMARGFYVSGRMRAALYDFTNPTAAGRDYQDKRFTIEHFHSKLLKLASGFQTAEGARLAARSAKPGCVSRRPEGDIG